MANKAPTAEEIAIEAARRRLIDTIGNKGSFPRNYTDFYNTVWAFVGYYEEGNNDFDTAVKLALFDFVHGFGLFGPGTPTSVEKSLDEHTKSD